MMEHMDLPVIVNGKEVQVSDATDKYVLSYNKIEIRIPKLNEEMIKSIEEFSIEEMRKLSTHEIVTFLSKVGKLWKNPDYKYRKMLFEFGPMITEQSFVAYEHIVNLFVGLLCWKEFLQDIMDSELGKKQIMDEWVPHYTAYVHAEPLGKLLHIMAGNVPIAGIYSLVRGILTKNTNTAKLPGRDVLTLLLLVKSFQDVDPEHPITRSTSVVYWERSNEEIINRFTGMANGICIWGGQSSVDYYKAKAPSGCETIVYGPKNSAQIIKYGSDAPKDLTFKIARDICLYEQEACLSPQVIYFEGEDIDGFIESLKQSLYLYSEIIPKGNYEIDHYAHLNYTILCNAFCGNPSYKGEKLDWLIVKMKNKTEISLEHPLGRTIFIYEMKDIRECLKYMENSNVQTVAIYPLQLAHELRDELSKRGIMRITYVGGMDAPRLGVVHDGVYLNRLVRMVGMDRELSYVYKLYDLPDDYQHRFAFEKRRLEEKNLLGVLQDGKK
jgi:long-chain-fatty-acyl-CoA reductase